MRGVILGPKIEMGGHCVSSAEKIDSAIKRSILYYDKIDSPSSHAVFFEPSAVMTELMAAGVLKRSKAVHGTVTISNIGEYFRSIQFALFEHLESKEPGVWSVGQESASLSLPIDVLTQGRSLEVTLAQLLPVPADDVPVAEILAFKAKRSAEMRAFEAAMESLYQMIANATDQARAYEFAKETIRYAVADMFKAMKEAMTTRILAFAKIAVRTGEGISAAALGNSIGAAAAGIHLATMATETPSSVKRLGPFAFVHGVIQELV